MRRVVGGDTILSKGYKVTSSEEPIIGELALVTDGDKEHDEAAYIELAPQLQWVHVDLGAEKQIYAACVWHDHGSAYLPRCDLPDLQRQGVYRRCIRSPFTIPAMKPRYIRFYSCGNTANEMNHYTEVEIYGKYAMGNVE